MTSICLDHKLVQQMAGYIEQLTTSGRHLLDIDILKKLKKICRISDQYVEQAFHLLMTQLRREHAEIRLSAFQVIEELFSRSHAFRQLMVSDFQTFLELTVEIDQSNQPTLQPAAAGRKLKCLTLKSIQHWQDKFGSSYKKLSLGYNYLKTCKQVDFDDIRARTVAERRRASQQEDLKLKKLAIKLDIVRKEIAELKDEIEKTALETENSIRLLLPKPTDDELFADISFVNKQTDLRSDATLLSSTSDARSGSAMLSGSSDSNTSSRNLFSTDAGLCEGILPSLTPTSVDIVCDELITQCSEMKSSKTLDFPVESNRTEEGEWDDKEDEQSFLDSNEMVKTHGLGSRQYNLQIEINTCGTVDLLETEDNKDLYQSLRDSSRLICVRYLPQVVKWLEILSKTGAHHSEIKEMINLKVTLEELKLKCMELHLVDPALQILKDCSDSDEEFESVPEKEGYEPFPLSTDCAGSKLEQSFKPDKTVASDPQLKVNKASGKESAGNRVKVDCWGKRSAAHWSLKASTSLLDPTSSASKLAKLTKDTERRQPSSKGKPATVTSDSVPVVPFGVDLAYWENPSQVKLPTIVKNDSLHRFWTPPEVETEIPSTSDLAAVMNRTFHYVGKFEPAKWKCRAKLPNGYLCERMDRIKCPFHGTIIPRDENGIPSGPTGSWSREEVNNSVKYGDTDLPERDLLTVVDIGQASGLQGKKQRSKGKGRGKVKKYAGLTDIRQVKNTSRSRLETRVFNK